MKIVVFDRMFTSTKRLCVLDENKVVRETTANPNSFMEVLFQLVDEFNCDSVDIKGTKMFSKGLQREIQKYELAKYNENKITVNII